MRGVQHFLRVVIQALSEYVVEIAATGSDYHMTQQFLNALPSSEQNLSFAYVVFFLYMFGFKYLDYRQAPLATPFDRLLPATAAIVE